MLRVVVVQVKKAREAGTVDALTLQDSDTGLPFKVRAFMRLDRKVYHHATLSPFGTLRAFGCVTVVTTFFFFFVRSCFPVIRGLRSSHGMRCACVLLLLT